MADYFDEEDEDAKADELPSDEEGDAITGNHNKSLSQPQGNINRKPKTPPPVLDNFAMNMNMNDTVQLQQELSNSHLPQSLYASDSFSPRSQNSATSPRLLINDTPNTSNIMAFHPDSMQQRQHRQHVPSKTMPVQLPQFWTCQMCTFAENSINSPVCGVCGALPPMDNNDKKKLKSKSKPKKKKKKKQDKPKISIKSPQPQAVPVFVNDNVLSPRAYQPSHHQHQQWQQQTRARHNNHEMNHFRAKTEQIPQKSFAISQNMLPNFLEEDDDEKDLQQPSMYDIKIY